MPENKNDGTAKDLNLGPPRKAKAVHSGTPPKVSNEIHERREMPVIVERPMATITRDFAKHIHELFAAEYYKPPMDACGLSKVGVINPNAPKNEHENYCIVVRFEEEPTPEQAVPDVFMGMRIFKTVGGPIRIG